MTRILFVEDDPTYGPILHGELAGQAAGIEIVHVVSRDAALRELSEQAWDLIICDLMIPAEDGGLDPAIEHGLFVIDEAQRMTSGTPVIVLSALITVDIVQDLVLKHARQEAIYGAGNPEPMVTSCKKTQLDRCLASAQHHASEVDRLSNIEVVGVDSNAVRRVLRVFASRQNGDRVTARVIAGGLSSASVMRIEVFRGAARVARVLARVTKKAAADREITAFNQVVSPMLPNWLFTPRAEVIVTPAQNIGIFYTLIGSGDTSLFDSLRTAPAGIAPLITQLQVGTSNWIGAGSYVQMTVADVRRSFVDDEAFQRVQPLLGACRWQVAEPRQIPVRKCPQHNDLHGLNVLLDGDHPVLIDYGDLGESPSATDPVTLELCPFFHPSGVPCDAENKAAILAGGWWTQNRTGSLGVFTTACRAWAGAVAAGERERLACAYGYAARQLKYPDTDKELAAAIATAAIEALLSTF